MPTSKQDFVKTLKIKEDYHFHSADLTFSFDRVFPPGASQSAVFNTIGKDLVSDALNGFNGTLFAYG